jgi:hypothetical protein
MQKFIDATLRPVLIIGGLGTAGAMAYALAPQITVETISNLEFSHEYTIFVQYLGDHGGANRPHDDRWSGSQTEPTARSSMS